LNACRSKGPELRVVTCRIFRIQEGLIMQGFRQQ
jgi:hypothetical protein